MTERFVVGTGRCGSTLLSSMLAQHPDVVSIHEFFTGLDWGRRFAPGLVTGDDLADLIGAEQPVTTAVLARGYSSDEITYPFGTAGARFAPGDPVPWLLVTMLSRLTDDPHPLYDALMDEARGRPPASLADHYRALFGWLAKRCGGSIWIERSGSSLDYLGELAGLYPDARFVHIHRDGREAALSIREHPFFRLGVSLFMDLFPPGDDEDAIVTEVIETPPPCWAVGRYWSDQVLRGFAALPRLDADQFLQVRFEDLVTSTAQIIEEIAAFFELPPDPLAIERAAAMARGLPPTRFDSLTLEEQAELTDACRPGQLLLGRLV
jgi:hypothetical protein